MVPIKALHLRSTFDPGGIESLMIDLYNYKQDYIRFYYALLKDGCLIGSLENKNNRYFCFFRKKTVDLLVIWKLNRLLRRERIQVIQSHQMIELGYALLLKLLNPKIKVYHFIHGLSFKLRFYRNLEKFLIGFTRQTFTVSASARDYFKGLGFPVNKIQILYNAISPQKQINLPENIERTINRHVNEKIIVMIGNFVKEKDQLTLCKAFNLLANVYPNIKLVLIGDELDKGFECRKALNPFLLDKRVFFTGVVAHASSYLCNFDLMVFSSRSETFGISVVESILAGIPVIASDIPPMIELSEGGEHFRLFRTGDCEDLVNKLSLIFKANSFEELKNQTLHSASYFRDKYSYDKYIQELFKIYAE
jgi:L-malate glycosyltransferase